MFVTRTSERSAWALRDRRRIVAEGRFICCKCGKEEEIGRQYFNTPRQEYFCNCCDGNSFYDLVRFEFHTHDHCFDEKPVIETMYLVTNLKTGANWTEPISEQRLNEWSENNSIHYWITNREGK